MEGSRSKAENLNSALELVGTENVVIYDADHHADPDSLMIATRYMRPHLTLALTLALALALALKPKPKP